MVNASGFDLSELDNGEWAFNIRGGNVYIGTFAKVVTYMAQFGFDLDEIDLAVRHMVKAGHNTAHFGMYKSFIFTVNREFNFKRRAG